MDEITPIKSYDKVWKIAETLLIAFIIGGITMWGSTQRMDERLKTIEAALVAMTSSTIETAKELKQHEVIQAGTDSARDLQIKINTEILRELRADQLRRKALERTRSDITEPLASKGKETK